MENPMLSVIQAANMGQQSAAMGQEIRNAIERASIQREAHMRQKWRDERNAAVEDASIQMRMLGAGRGVTGGQVQETAAAPNVVPGTPDSLLQGAQVNYSRAADPGRTLSYKTADGRNIETELYTPEDISQRATVAEVARQKMLGDVKLEQEQRALNQLQVDIPGYGLVSKSIATPLINLRAEGDRLAQAAKRQEDQQKFLAEQEAGRQKFQGEQGTLNRASREKTTGERIDAVDARAARREELAAAKAAKKATPETLAALVLQQSAAGGGQTIDDAIKNAGTFYQNDPRFTPEMRASVMVELAKMKQSGKTSSNPLRVKKPLTQDPPATTQPPAAKPQLLTSVSTAVPRVAKSEIPAGARQSYNAKTGETAYLVGDKWVIAQ